MQIKKVKKTIGKWANDEKPNKGEHRNDGGNINVEIETMGAMKKLTWE